MLESTYKTIYSGTFYGEAATKGRGIGFSLLGLLSVLTMVMVLIKGYVPMEHAFDNFVPRIIAQMPTITLINGVMSIDKPTPYRVQLVEGEAKLPTNIVFLGEEINNLDEIYAKLNTEHAVALATPTKVIWLDNRKNQLKIMNLGDDLGKSEKPFILTPFQMQKFVRVIRFLFWPFVMVAGILGLWVYRIVQALLFSLVAMVLNLIVRTKLHYVPLLRFSSYAVWVACLIDLLFMAFKLHLPTFAFIGFVVLYLIYALVSVRKIQKTQSVLPPQIPPIVP